MIAKRTLYEAFYDSANKNLDRTCLIYKKTSFTYRYVLNKVNCLAMGLKNAGYKEDDVITIMLPNVPFAIFLLYAVNQIGAIANLIHPLMKFDELKEIMEKTKSKTLFALDNNIHNFIKFKSMDIKLYAVSPVYGLNSIIRFLYYRKNNKSSEEYASKFIDKQLLTTCDKSYLKDSFYLHSGGTTGYPKTIALSSFAINSITVQGLKIVDLKSGIDCGMLSVLPMFHGFGLVMGIHIHIVNSGFDVLMPKFSTKETIYYLKKGKIQTLIGVPPLYEALLRNKAFKGNKLKRIYNAFVGGDFVSESLRFRFNERMMQAGSKARLYEGYGLTETVTMCTVNTHPEHKDGSVGRPIDNVRVKIFNTENNKEILNDDNGEIYVSGDTLMNGYRFEKENKNPFYIDKDHVKWVKTGDYGHLDKDGYLYFVQRIKRLIKVSGINVFPSAIENEIMTLPYVFECYCKGVRDEARGNMLNLYIVLDRQYKGNTYNSEINDLIINKFGIYALPKKIIYLDKLPKTLVGKVDEKKIVD